LSEFPQIARKKTPKCDSQKKDVHVILGAIFFQIKARQAPLLKINPLMTIVSNLEHDLYRVNARFHVIVSSQFWFV